MNDIQQNSFVQEDDTLDIKKYFFLILGNWYWFFIALMIALSIAWVVNRYTRSVYQVSASLIIKENDPGRATTGIESAIPALQMLRTQQKVLNEMEILKSYWLADKAIAGLNFGVSYFGVGRSGFKIANVYNYSPYVVIADTSKPNACGYPVYIYFIDKATYRLHIDGKKDINVILRFGEPYRSDLFNFTVIQRDTVSFSPDAGYNKNYFVFNDHNTLVNTYKNKIDIKPNDEKKGSVLFLTTKGNNASQEVAYLNKLMEVYIRQGLEDKNQTAVNTVNFIDQQLGILNDSLQGAEKDLQDFRLSKRLFDLPTEGSMVYSRLDKYYQDKAMLELQDRYYAYLLDYVKNKNNLNQVVTPAVMDISDPLLTSLLTQLNSLLAEKSELQFSVQKGNPKMSEVEAQIETMQRSLIDNINNLIHNNTIALQQTRKMLGSAEEELEQLPVTERQLINIKRQYNVNDQIYTFLLQKRAEAAIAMASNVADNKILDMARVENAVLVAPKARMNYTIGLLLGLLIPFGILILIELSNTKITGREEVEKASKVPVIGGLGHYTGHRQIAVLENPRSALAESFRGVRTNLQYLLKGETHKIIMVTSTISGEGKTFTSVNLASIFALGGMKTLLIGLDLRKPALLKIFDMTNKTGLSTYLIGKSSADEVILPTSVDNLFIAPAGPVPPNPAELIGTPLMGGFMKKVREEFDIVIADTPPFGLVTDALLVGRYTDANLFMVRQMYSSRDVLEPINELYVKKEIKNIGIILNDVKPAGYYYQKGYRYYTYGYGYGYGYSSYGNRHHYYEEEPAEPAKGLWAKWKAIFKGKP